MEQQAGINCKIIIINCTVTHCLLLCNAMANVFHLSDIYLADTKRPVNLRLLPKVKYEHIYLTNFSKMRVDLAAQVRII